MMSTLRRRTPVNGRSTGTNGATERPSVAPGTVLGWFTEARHRIEVLVAGETRLWLRAWRRDKNGAPVMVDLGPISWNEYRTPSLEPVPDWLDSGPLGALPIVVKSMALLQAVVHGTPADPALQLAINPALGDLSRRAGPEARRNP
jgi:hypothetical protein